MAYLFSEIIGSLIVVALVAFALGWFLRGLKAGAWKPKVETQKMDSNPTSKDNY